MSRSSRLPALAAAGVTVCLWASAFVGIRAAGDELSAGALSLGRLLVGSVVLGAIVRFRREPLPPRGDVGRLLVCGLLWFAAYNVLLNAAEQRIDAGTAAMLVNVGPVLIAVLAGVLLHEGFPRSLLTDCAIAFAGAIIIGLATSHGNVDAGWSALLCFAAAAAYAGAVVAQKPLLAVLMGWAFLGETPPALALAGGALCLVGVAVTRAQPSARGMRTSTAPAGGSSPGA